MSPPIVLRYVGHGAYLTGVPARDLTAADVAALTDYDADALVASGLYAPVDPATSTKGSE